ncbi:DUF4825 domain-containing protein [Paenibacillus sp. FSL W8-0919]|uniref:DUF4825 domain-containing protein n=1 Tax=Paenibacillus sp. FSL W8-0919 TaxID=2954707 RepID=UPI0030F6403C
MSRKNVWIVVLLIIGISGLIALEGFIKPRANAQAVRYEAEQNDPLTHDIRQSIPYLNKYMGNAVNFANLNASLPFRSIGRTIQMYPDRLTAEILYQARAGELAPDKLNAFFMYNSTANFALIDNLEELIFTFEDQSFTIRRDEVETWYREVGSVALLRDADLWRAHVQSRIADEDQVTDFVTSVVRSSSQNNDRSSI